MPSDGEIDSLVGETSTLATALQAANTLGDVLAVKLLAMDLWIRFAAGTSPQITSGQLERLLDSRIAFSQHDSPKLHALLNRPGIAPCFSRTSLGRRTPEVRRLPRRLRAAIAKLPDNLLRLAAYTTNRVSGPIVDVALLDHLELLPEDAATLLQFNLASVAVENPEMLAFLPERAKTFLRQADATRVWFPRSHPLLAEYAESREATIMDIERAQGYTRLDLLKALQAAVETRSTAAVRDAIRCLKAQAWFFTATESGKLSKEDFCRYDGSLSLSAILRHARQADILYDQGEFAVFECAAEPCRRYFVRFPSFAAAFSSQATEGAEAEFRAAPLRFAIQHSAERNKSPLMRAIRNDLDRLEIFRREVGIAATADWLGERVANLAKGGVAALPQLAFAATAYLSAARQLGFQDALAIAELEGFVQLLLGTLPRGSRAEPD